MGLNRPLNATRRLATAASTDSRAGFSLVETMVALSILAVGILSVAQLLTTSRAHSNYSRQETMAISLAQEVKERIYSENFDDVKSIFDTADTDDPSTINDSTDEWAQHLRDMLGSNGRGTIDVIDETEDASLPEGMYQVIIDITWVEGPRDRSLPHTFLLAKVGL